ncbi:MAG: DUF3108 domain-containing protein [Candidatus Omnitrophica bacterium]|nr:DUF3108 domain-containing protein [Candidatus Omnitrophota bacterium]
MKKTLYIILIVILFLMVVWHVNNNPKFIASHLIKSGGIHPGNLKYRVNFFGIIPVGEAIFTLEKIEDYKGKKVYHLNATAQLLKLYSGLWKGHAIIDSYVDMQALSPVLFKQKLEAPGKENPNKEVFYDLENSTMSLDGVVRPIYPNTQDPLSAIFNLKRMDFTGNKEIEFNINTNQKNYILKGTAKEQELLIDNKMFKIITMNSEIKRRDRDPHHKSNVEIILLKAEQNIPILIKVFASGALITVKLVEIN